MNSQTIGILGGGQLGRMMVEAANRLGIKTLTLDAPGAPAKDIGPGLDGNFKNADAVYELAKKVDVLTIEIEHVNVSALDNILKTLPNVKIRPSPATIRTIQDKYLQKQHLIDHGIDVTQSIPLDNSVAEIQRAGSLLGYPFMLKTRKDAYDGRGNFVVKDTSSAEEALEALKDNLYAEKWCPFTKELAVMVVQDINGECKSFPTVETIHKNSVCHVVFAPARVPDSVLTNARMLAERAVYTFAALDKQNCGGIFGVEMFVTPDSHVLVNEIAPRPHNSGHYTQNGCVTSQFEAHIRAVAGLPLPKSLDLIPNSASVMLNILGEPENAQLDICKKSLEIPGACIHLYGKGHRVGRKLGHINIVSGSITGCENELAKLLPKDDVAIKTIGSNWTPGLIKSTSKSPSVGIIMGSDSDLKVMSAAADILREFEVPFELTIVSAHRTPDRMVTYSRTAPARGIKAIIAGAGGAAHLPGMVAALTRLPVIGVPVKGSTLDGVDSLHSIVQMPRGVPVATVAINNSTNAALLAIRMLSVNDAALASRLDNYIAGMESTVLDKAAKLETIGYKEYLNL
ncbi:hypothetical protein CANCADRAFT_133364 [Tortispora caseinolytica NRRL Y-17796]|uniref:Phosphoribosylaminoimidazole carboxylase n=1 Tax=Tortispora caseinolytica NRRL Y-17796 TaxID=767744 RepID=A0A1E4TBC6_9ASCO|nr:hypothetical protein CANCADRAFT_133364 [Tortispora caseinolytica NRRL Y-17796]